MSGRLDRVIDVGTEKQHSFRVHIDCIEKALEFKLAEQLQRPKPKSIQPISEPSPRQKALRTMNASF